MPRQIRTTTGHLFRSLTAKRRAFLFTAALLLFRGGLAAQNGAGYTTGPHDNELPQPTTTGILGRFDTGALEEVTGHLKTVGASPWLGMQGIGQIVYGAQDPTTYPATLSIMGKNHYRLDAQSSAGPVSQRFQGKTGALREATGTVSMLPMDTAALGLLQFDLLRLASFPDTSSSSLIAKNSVSVDGVTLNRIAYEFSLAPRDTSKMAAKTAVTDLYFDTSTHLLIKSSVLASLPSSHNNKLLQVTTYSDYRKVGPLLIPFHYVLTLEGQLQWTLQLTAVTLSPALNSAFFHF